jgi:hypothetical protein
MHGKIMRLLLVCLSLCMFAPTLSRAQSMNAVLSGEASDSSGATAPGAPLKLAIQETGAVASFTMEFHHGRRRPVHVRNLPVVPPVPIIVRHLPPGNLM